MVDELSLEETVQEGTPLADYANRIKTGIGSLYIKEADKPYFGTWLTDFTKGLTMLMHYTERGPVPCKKSKVFTANPDKTECETCKTLDPFDPKKKKLNKAHNVLIMLGYWFDSVGKVLSYENKDGDKVEYNDNPIKFAILKRGNNDVNLTNMKDYHEQGELMDDIWELKKFPKEAKKAMVPVVANKTKVNKNFAHIGGCVVPEDVREWADSLTVKDVRGLAVNLFAHDASKCVNWEDPHLLKFVNKPAEVKEEKEQEAPEEIGGGTKADAGKDLDG